MATANAIRTPTDTAKIRRYGHSRLPPLRPPPRDTDPAYKIGDQIPLHWPVHSMSFRRPNVVEGAFACAGSSFFSSERGERTGVTIAHYRAHRHADVSRVNPGSIPPARLGWPGGSNRGAPSGPQCGLPWLRTWCVPPDTRAQASRPADYVCECNLSGGTLPDWSRAAGHSRPFILETGVSFQINLRPYRNPRRSGTLASLSLLAVGRCRGGANS